MSQQMRTIFELNEHDQETGTVFFYCSDACLEFGMTNLPFGKHSFKKIDYLPGHDCETCHSKIAMADASPRPVGTKITLVLVVIEPDKICALWDMMSRNFLLCGCAIETIADGDKVSEHEEPIEEA